MRQGVRYWHGPLSKVTCGARHNHAFAPSMLVCTVFYPLRLLVLLCRLLAAASVSSNSILNGGAKANGRIAGRKESEEVLSRTPDAGAKRRSE